MSAALKFVFVLVGLFGAVAVMYRLELLEGLPSELPRLRFGLLLKEELRGGEFPRPGEKVLVARIWAVTHSQLGNHIYELLSFQGMAKRLGRRPVYVFGDEYTMSAQRNIWNLQFFYPQLIRSIEFVYDDSFYKKKWPTISIRNPHMYVNVSERVGEFAHDDVVVLDGRHFQNVQYLDDFGGHEYISRTIFDFPVHQQLFAKHIVPKQFHEAETRLCVHMRRKDFIKAKAQFSTMENVIPQVKHILRSVGSNFSIAFFGDDDAYAKKLIEDASFKEYKSRSYIPIPYSVYFVWTFTKHYCTDIYLSSASSTFGFWCGYAAPNTTNVFIIDPADKSKKQKTPPANWIELPEKM